MTQEVAFPRNGSMPIPAPASEGAALLAVIERAARDASVDIDKLEKLLAMRERMEQRKAEQDFHAAMTAAQTEMRAVSTDAVNPQTRSRYATYAALDRALRPIYTKHGFSLSFDTADGAPPDWVRVVCDVACGGHARRYHVDMPADGIGAKGGAVMTRTHATGSAITYGRRYLLLMIFNIAVGEVEDDDGNAAGGGRENITEAQAAELEKLLKETGGDVAKFCTFAKVEMLAELPAIQFEAARRAIVAAGTRRKQEPK